MIEIIFSVLSIIFLIGIVVALIVITRKKLKKFTFVQRDIPHFSKDIQFTPYPDTVNVENQLDCNIDTLKPCKLNDSTTLFGCKELLVRCHHFDKDTPYVENNKRVIIPKNKTKNDGYALAITSLVKACNPYHGDLTLVSSTTNSSEYMLICTCKNPGYIGNETILGNCSTPFICNGRVDNINQPLNKINCICSRLQYSTRYDDGLPVCKDLTVNEANKRYKDWTSLVTYQSSRQLNLKYFNKTVAGNLNVKRLLNPCTNSLINSRDQIKGASFNFVTHECSVSNLGGIPLDVGMLDYTRTGGFVGASAVLKTGPIRYARFTDNVAGKRRLIALAIDDSLFTPRKRNFIVSLKPGMTIGMNRTVSFKTKNQIYSPSCRGSWPKYYCDEVSLKSGHMLGDLVIASSRDIPGAFLWNQTEWREVEGTMQDSFDYSIDDGYSMMPRRLGKYERFRAYGVKWVPESEPMASSLLKFVNYKDFKLHKDVST